MKNHDLSVIVDKSKELLLIFWAAWRLKMSESLRRVVVQAQEKYKKRMMVVLALLVTAGVVMRFFGIKEGNAFFFIALVFWSLGMWINGYRMELIGNCGMTRALLFRERFYLPKVVGTSIKSGEFIGYRAGGPKVCRARKNYDKYNTYVDILLKRFQGYAGEPDVEHVVTLAWIRKFSRAGVFLSTWLLAVCCVTRERIWAGGVGTVTCSIVHGVCCRLYYWIEKRNLVEYGEEIEATLVDYLDIRSGKAYPLFEFSEENISGENKKHMLYGLERIKVGLEDCQKGMTVKILYAPGRAESVLWKR